RNVTGVQTCALPILTDEPSVARAVDKAAALLGGLDVAIANAGVLSLRPLAELSAAELEHTLRVNVVGTFLTFKHAVPHLRAAGEIGRASCRERGWRG